MFNFRGDDLLTLFTTAVQTFKTLGRREQLAFSAGQMLVGPWYCLSIWLAWPCPSRIAGVSFLALPHFFHSDPPPRFNSPCIAFITQSDLVRFSPVLLSSRKFLTTGELSGLSVSS